MWILIVSIIIFLAIIGGMFYLALDKDNAAPAQQQGNCPCGGQCPCMGCGRGPRRCGCPSPKPRCNSPNPGCSFC